MENQTSVNPGQVDPLVSVFGHDAFHEPVYIVGNIEGIRKLYFACATALQLQGEAVVPVFVNDGEGYDLHVSVDSRLNMYDGKYAVPYTADYAKEQRECAIYPWTR